MKYFIYPYTQGSRSAKALAEELDGKRVLRSGSSYKHQKDHLLINWGCGECPHPQALNYKIMDLINKTKFFNRLKGTGLTPPFASTLEGAKSLGYPVFCRTTVEGHDGKGIVIADCIGQLVDAPLYVKGIGKDQEYRVHVGRLPDGTTVILGGAKKGKKQVTAEMTNVPTDPRIWCGDTTYFGDFTTSFPMPVQNVVTQAFAMFPELTFAAFDVVYDSSTGAAFVIEANSAPMATPATTKAYADFFRKYAEQVCLPTPEPEPVQPATPVAPPVATIEPKPTSVEELDGLVNKLRDKVCKGEISVDELIRTYIKVTF